MTDARPNILLVDDDKDILSFMEAALHTIGASCILCEDGAKALALIEEKKKDFFNLIILDCLLPKMHGFDVLKAIKSNQRTYHIPVIMISGIYKKRTYREDLIDNKKANGFLLKPFTTADLLNEIEPYINTEIMQQDSQKHKQEDDDSAYYGATFDELPEDDIPDIPDITEKAEPSGPVQAEKAIPSTGKLSEYPFSEIIRILCSTGSTATIKLVREDEKKIVLIKDGSFIWAMSNMIMHTLEHIMFMEGSLSLEQYFYFSKKAFGKQKEHINSQDILSTVSEGEKKALLRKQMQNIITDTFRWYDGRFIIENSLMKLASIEDIMMSTHEIIKNGVMSIKNWEVLKISFGSLQARFKYNKSCDLGKLKLIFSPEELALLKEVSNNMSLADILKSSSKPDFETLRLLYAFSVLGAIEPVSTEVHSKITFSSGPEHVSEEKPPSAPKKEEEQDIEERLEDDTITTYKVIRHDTTQRIPRPASTQVETVKEQKQSTPGPIDHFYDSVINEKNPLKILDISQGDSKDDIKKKYAKLVKEYHPDKYHNKVDTDTYNKLVAITDLLNKSFKAVIERYDDLFEKKQVDFKDFKPSEDSAQASAEDDARLKQQKEQISRNLFIKGRNAIIKKDYQAAFSSFRYLNSLDSENPEYTGYYGIAAYYVNQKTLAFELLSKVAESNINNPDLYYFIGKVYAERNQKTKAREFFNKALTFDPLHEPSQNALDNIDSPGKGSKDGSFLKKIFKK